MSGNRRSLLAKLEKAHQQLREAQAEVAALETQLGEDGLTAGEDLPKELLRTVPATRSSHWDQNEYEANVQRLNLFVEHAPAAIAMLDAEMRYLQVSRRWLDDYRLRETDVIGRSHYEIFPDIPERWREIHRRCLQGAVESNEADPFPRADGSMDWVRWEIRPWRKSGGEVGGIIIFSEVITARKTAQDELQALYEATATLFSANTLVDLAQQITEAVVRTFEYVDCGLILFDYQQQTLRRLGRAGTYHVQTEHPLMLDGAGLVPLAIRTGELVYAPDVTLSPDYLASDRRTRSELVIPLKTAQRIIGALDLQHDKVDAFSKRDQRILTAFGERAAAAIETRQLYETVNQHATELERRVDERTNELQCAKERAEAILHNSPDGILLIEPDLSIRQTNAMFNKLLRCAPTGCAGTSLLEVLHPEDADTVAEQIKAIIATRQGRSFEVRAVRQDGSVFDAELSVGVIKGDGLTCSIRDITERKAQERELRFHAALQENMTDAVIVTDMDGTIQSWNKAAVRIYGWSAEETVGKNVSDVWHTEFASPDESQRNRQQLREQGWWQAEMRQQHQEGGVLHILSSATLLRDDDRVPFGVVIVNRDITARKRVEEELRRSAAEIHDLYNRAPCGYHSIDANAFVCQINDTELHWLGYEREEVVGKLTIKDILTPDSFAIMEKAFPVFKKSGWISDLKLDLVRKDGSAMPILFNSNAIYDETGAYLHSRSSLFDMTQLRQTETALIESEARYRLLAENVSDVIAKVNPQGFRTFTTPSCYELLGYTPEELLGTRAVDIIHPDDRLNSVAAVGQAVKDGKASQSFIHRFCRKDGTYVWGEVTTSIVRKPDTGELVELVSVIRDITERKHAEDALAAKMETEREFQTYLKALQDITIQLTQIDDLETFYKSTVELGRTGLGFERLALFLYDPQAGTAQGTFGTDAQGQPFDEHHIRFVPDPKGIMMRAFKQKERFYYDERVPLFADDRPVGSGWNAAAILWNGAACLGWLVADNLLSQKPASKPLLDSLGLYALTIGTLLAQKQAQSALRDSEARYRMLAENVTDVVIRTNAQGAFVYVSPSSTTVMGYSPQELDGKSVLAFRHPDEQLDIEALLSNAISSDAAIFKLVRRFRHKQGHYIWLEAVGRVIYADDTGALSGFVGTLRDVSERKRIEDALHESEERFRQLAENFDQMVIIRSGDSQKTLYINAAAESMLGISREVLYAEPTSYLSLIHAEDRNRVHRIFTSDHYLNDGQSDFEFRYIHADQQLRWLRMHTFPIRDEQGSIKLRVGICEDITDRKHADELIRDSEARYRLLVETMRGGLITMDIDGRITYVNNQFCEMIGYYREDLLDMKVDDYVVKADLDTMAVQIERRRQLESTVYALRLRHHDGHTISVLVSGAPLIDRSGTYVGSFSVLTDISEQKQAEDALRESEARYRQLLDTMQGGLVIFDINSKIYYVNDRLCDLLGYSRAEILGTTPFDYVDPSQLAKMQSQVGRQRHLESSTYELIFRHKDGRPIYMLVSGSPLVDRDGEFSGGFAVLNDIGVQKQAEEALRQALAKERELNELKTRFVSMASHEFRTPLATILTLTETLSFYRHKMTDAKIDERLDKIKEQVDYLKDIMEDVLMLARMQSRRAEFNPIMLDLDVLCRSVVEEYESRADVTHWFDYRCSGEAREVKLDPKLMRQIISNLISNAIKYSTEESTVSIEMEFRGAAVILKVHDQGIGIPQEDLTYLFEPFHRGTNVGTISGTGLGLAITKESVERHGGTISVESQIGVGTTFTICLPIASNEAHG